MCRNALKSLSMKLASPFKSLDPAASGGTVSALHIASVEPRREESFTVHLGLFVKFSLPFVSL